MNDLILHHYPTSPFSEKVRLVLGLKKMRWQSVFVPAIMPKPDVVALTGGYRRTPFMQIGADIYCDSALMCRVIDRLVPTPPLYPAESAGMAEIVAQWADSSLFWTAVPYTMQPAGIAHLFAGAPVEALRAFGADRAAMSPNLRRAPLADAAAALSAYYSRLEAMLGGGRSFLLGESPSIADFAAFHSLWFMRRAPPVAAAFSDFTRVAAWYERVAGFGHGEPSKLSSEDALAIAAGASGHAPASVAPGQGFEVGDAVTVTPADYAHDDVAGTIVGLDRDEVVIARSDARAGTVHVHFPRIGFHIKAVKKDSA
jgi:glutathione S-transferase